MKQAAVVLGIIGGVLGLIAGISVAGWVALTGLVEADGVLAPPDNAALLRVTGVLAPLVAIAGGAMAVLRPVLGGVLLLGAAAAMWAVLGLGFFTLFPIAACALAGVFALAGAGAHEPGTLPRRR